MNRKQYKKTDKNKIRHGFTLVELVVVVAIIAIVSSIVIPNFKAYNSNVLLTNAAYTLALAVRQTQFFGIAVKGSGGSDQNSYSDAYGVHFSSQSSSYIVYQDIPNTDGDLQYYYTGSDSTSPEFMSSTPINTGYSVQKICIVQSGIDTACATNTTNTFIDIEFARPNPDAIITTNISGANVTYLPNSSSGQYGARIYLTSGSFTRTMYVDETGQIAVN